MEIFTRYALDYLCEETVTVLIGKYIVLDGEKTKVGETDSRFFNNTQKDREELSELVPANFYHAIIDIWGPEPLFEDINRDAEE